MEKIFCVEKTENHIVLFNLKGINGLNIGDVFFRRNKDNTTEILQDYEKMGREVEYGIGGPDDEEELSMQDIFDAYNDEDFEMPIDEAKKDEEEVDAEVDTEVAVEEPAMDAEPAPSQGLSAEEQEIQNSLKIAYDNAVAVGDQN